MWTHLEMLPEITIDREAPLTYDILGNPSHPVTTLLLRLYSFECFLYGSLNKALRFGDTSKVQSLGPYAHAMDKIVEGAGRRRENIKKEDLSGIDLYRGCCMTEAQIQKYRDAIPKGKSIQLFGHTSCSKSIKLALGWANANEDKKPVLYHIVWSSSCAKWNCYVMDKTVSAYPNEKEVLLRDGK